MNLKIASLTGIALGFLSVAPAIAQQLPTPASPAPGCTSTPAQLAETKKVALNFAVLTGEPKVALADPTYIQHNPAQHKRALQEKTSDFESFKKTFLAQAAAAAGGGGGGAAAGPRPPEGNRYEVIVAECDIVVVIHKVFLQDPTEKPGTFYEANTFDAYRVKNGKVIEHWDAGTIAPPR